MAAARAVRIGSVRVGRSVGSQRVGATISVVHVEGQVVRLGSGESDGVVDAEEFVQEAWTFAALDVAAAAAGVVVGVERHGWKRILRLRCPCKRRIWSTEYFLDFGCGVARSLKTSSLKRLDCLQFETQAFFFFEEQR